jgi:hypothetical protein
LTAVNSNFETALLFLLRHAECNQDQIFAMFRFFLDEFVLHKDPQVAQLFVPHLEQCSHRGTNVIHCMLRDYRHQYGAFLEIIFKAYGTNANFVNKVMEVPEAAKQKMSVALTTMNPTIYSVPRREDLPFETYPFEVIDPVLNTNISAEKIKYSQILWQEYQETLKVGKSYLHIAIQNPNVPVYVVEMMLREAKSVIDVKSLLKRLEEEDRKFGVLSMKQEHMQKAIDQKMDLLRKFVAK